MEAVKAFGSAPAVLDLFMWLTYRCFTAKSEERIPLFGDFGLTAQLESVEYSRPRRFRAMLQQWLGQVRAVWPNCPAQICSDGQYLRLSPAKAILPTTGQHPRDFTCAAPIAHADGAIIPTSAARPLRNHRPGQRMAAVSCFREWTESPSQQPAICSGPLIRALPSILGLGVVYLRSCVDAPTVQRALRSSERRSSSRRRPTDMPRHGTLRALFKTPVENRNFHGTLRAVEWPFIGILRAPFLYIFL